MQPALLARYLETASDSRETRWIELDRVLYFAGDSRNWGGSVAFVSLTNTTDLEMFTTCLAIEVNATELRKIFRSENGLGADLGCLTNALDVGEWLEVLMRRPNDPRQGKYNVVLRGPDLAGQPSFTFSTVRTLALGSPSHDYATAIRSGLAAKRGETSAVSYLARRTVDVSGDNRIFMPSTLPGPAWSGEVTRGAFSGYPAVRLPRSLAPVAGARNLLGRITIGGNEAHVWVDFGLDDGDEVKVASAVARQLGLDAAGRPAVVTLDEVVARARLSGVLDDISVSDVVQVSEQDQLARSRWALAIAPQFSAPVRVLPRGHVPEDMVRVAYALRILLDLDRGDPFALQPIQPITTSSRLRRGPRLVLERILGAPTLALRATEGLVGDDGKMVVRADSAALDFVGLQAGQEAVLTWADRAVVVRVLLQTPETRETMAAQLAESTGKQLRAAMADPTSRARSPSHLRLWVSSSVRHALGIPPDTVVRLRRSIRHTMIRSASLAAVPGVGLVVAAAALDLPWWIWLTTGMMLIFLVTLPLRLKPR